MAVSGGITSVYALSTTKALIGFMRSRSRAAKVQPAVRPTKPAKRRAVDDVGPVQGGPSGSLVGPILEWEACISISDAEK